jgi:hypothetical protein
MSRVITARLEDEQYDWLIERARDEEGDLSKALRDAIDQARIFLDLLNRSDPPAELREMIRRGEEDEAREKADYED